MKTTLPQDSQLRKEYPLFRGLLRYFPAALAGVSRHSKAGNDKHNPGEEMHHARSKSNDHADCIVRHLLDLDGLLARGQHAEDCKAILDEANALVWRTCALSQELHEKIGGAPLAPGARVGPIEQFVRDVYTGPKPVGNGPLTSLMVHAEPKRQGYPNPRCSRCQMDPCACIEHG